MPHCVVEYSRPLEQQGDPSVWVNAVFQGVLDSEIAQAPAIKVRAVGHDHYRIGAAVDDFIHVTLRLLAGRTLEQKQRLSKTVLAQLEQLGLSNAGISVEVCDMDADSYARVQV